MNIIPDFWNKTLIIDNENNIGGIIILEESNIPVMKKNESFEEDNDVFEDIPEEDLFSSDSD